VNELSPLLVEASSIARKVDVLFWLVTALCAGVAIAVVAVMLFFSVRYRRGSKADRGGGATQSTPIELAWTLTPLALFMGVFTWSLFLFVEMRTPPADARTIYVVAKQWMWEIQHPGGQREINVLHVPLGTPIRLTMTSQDVIHSFYVPAFRVKQDVLPGRYTQLWFTATKLGRFPLFCAEYCGLDHARMGGSVMVMRPADFAAWLGNQDTPVGLAAQGAQLLRRHGCGGCHGANASVHAPDLDGIYGRIVHLSDGRAIVADDLYLRDSMLLPNKDIVAGYEPIMPSFAGQLSEDDILALLAYLKSTSVRGSDRTLDSGSPHEYR
jgi:cytochrome c oxidase subunit 2